MGLEEELLERIRALEVGQAELMREVSALLPPKRQATRSHRPAPPQQLWPASSSSSSRTQRVAAAGRAAGLSRRHHKLILQSLGQAVHVLDLNGKVLYWNRHAEHLYGYSASEAIGQDITKLIINPRDIRAMNTIIENIFKGKCWRGKFPVRNKPGDRFSIAVAATPLYEDDGSLVGLVCLADDAQALEEIIAGPYISENHTSE
ncbi:hypothetical protein PR202_gb02505 [Eleusine coracana subsp. coracana]|uniref:PAS domain-containing protein n=1 Tax=Eleusine coracana subsp. coracana TaxID=191504 RepID=A0AAV5DZ51_ELECO|nr:hypothetical protein QOZ80_8BG0667700 [Eleusine coracana subsp. coracana]GJN15581.1 hypothetical protein PR202_gb02505 [Eleusine coracana subsp. coracana]